MVLVILEHSIVCQPRRGSLLGHLSPLGLTSIVHAATKITPSLILLSLPLLITVAPEDPFILETAGVALGTSGMSRSSSISGDLGPTSAILTIADFSEGQLPVSVCMVYWRVSMSNQKSTGETKHYLLGLDVQAFVLTLFVRCLSSYRTYGLLV